jgi:hypothetical protein
LLLDRQAEVGVDLPHAEDVLPGSRRTPRPTKPTASKRFGWMQSWLGNSPASAGATTWI